jgi:hypothetical protein
MEFSPWLEVAVRAAREAGHVLMDRFVRLPEPGEVSYKGHVNPDELFVAERGWGAWQQPAPDRGDAESHGGRPETL